MPGSVKSIILGGGLSAGSPATLLNFPIFSGATPPDTLINGNIRQDSSTPAKVYIGDDSVTAGATVIGGAVVNTLAGAGVCIGNTAVITQTALGGPSVVIGYGAKDVSFSGNSVVLGYNADGTSPNGSVVVIGATAKTSRDASVTIGYGASTLAATGATAIGYTASALRTQVTAIGYAASANGNNSIVIGQNSSTNQTDTVTIGVGISNTVAGSCVLIGTAFSSLVGLTANTVMLGCNTGVSTFIIGYGTTVAGATSALTIKMTPGTGTNIAGGSMTLLPSIGTGNSTPSVINLNTPAVGSSGTTPQTARTGFRVSASLTAADTDIMVYDQDNLTLARVSVGAADSGGVGFKVLRIPN